MLRLELLVLEGLVLKRKLGGVLLVVRLLLLLLVLLLLLLLQLLLLELGLALWKLAELLV